MKRRTWFIAASLVGWPLTFIIAVSVPAVVAKMVFGMKVPILWFVSLFAVLGLPTTVGMGISSLGFVLASLSTLEARKVEEPIVRRKVLIGLFALSSLVGLLYGLWFNLTRQWDTMF